MEIRMSKLVEVNNLRDAHCRVVMLGKMNLFYVMN